LFRHHEPGGVSPLEVKRRIGRARAKGLRVLDLTNARVRELLDVSESELTADDLTRCQEIADYARDAGFDAILAPSAARARAFSGERLKTRTRCPASIKRRAIGAPIIPVPIQAISMGAAP